MRAEGMMDNTLIVFTSDHGDMLGDHWLGEKELFFEESVRIPMIIMDPSPDADATRGDVVDAFVEAIDLVPTFLDASGGEAVPHRLEGRSLMPILRGETLDWRDAVFSECDYSVRHARPELGLEPSEARAFMVRTERWKYVLYEGFAPQLFDLENDPNELTDLGASAGDIHKDIRAEMHERLFQWMRQRRLRVGISDEEIRQRTGGAHKRGYLFGVW
jgi:arylsulfatase A-like enzyme